VTRFERWSVWITSLATLASGVVYLWMKYLLVNSDPFAVINHPWQPLVLKLHILVAPLLVFSVGMVALRHVWRHMKSRERSGRRSGLMTVVVLGPMILSGYLIQAITHQGWLRAMVISHIITGVLYSAGLLAHQFAAGGRAARAARAQARRVRRRRLHAGRLHPARPTRDHSPAG
jgi:cobalamin biosynthesis protein CobD/CbiB